MTRNLREALADPTKNFLAFFCVGIVLFTLVGDGFSLLFWENFGSWLQTHLKISNLALLRLWMSAFLVISIIVLIYATNITRWLKNIFLKVVGSVPPQPSTAPLTNTFSGLITAMSPKDDSPAEAVIKYHWNKGTEPHLKHCWLICTNKSLPYASTMIKKFTDERITQKVKFHYGDYELEDLMNPGQRLSLLLADDVIDDPNYISRLISCIYADAQKQGLQESEIIADYTGATKGMTAGIILACANSNRRLQYISQISPCPIIEVKIS